MSEHALLENHLRGECYRFEAPVDELIAYDSASFWACFEKMECYQKQGYYLVGYVSYEAGFLLNETLHVLFQPSDTPLLHFIVYATRKVEPIEDHEHAVSISSMVLESTYAEYAQAFGRVKQALKRGDSYQINLTTRCRFEHSGSALELYRSLSRHQSVEYAAFLPFSPVTVLSLSPELFFKKQGRRLTLKPMKGTMPASRDDKLNQCLKKNLSQDPKNLAENLIIIDLIRNDLSRCCHTGTVEVTKPFEVESFETVHQMTSEISGLCDKKLSFREILTGLFPCGSITGAPKVSTMRLIHQLESNPRGIYTGAIGYITPDNDMCFSVAIRTLVKDKISSSLGVGGGITMQSQCLQEWDEIQTKLAFCRKAYVPDFKLIESLKYRDAYIRLETHLARLMRSAQQLLFDIDIDAVRKKLIDYSQSLPQGLNVKVRVEVDYRGECVVEHQIIEDVLSPLSIYLCPEPINGDNPLLKHKTTHHSSRGRYQDLHEHYRTDGELIYFNQKKQITESRFHNVVIEWEGQLLTPEHSCGILPGIHREMLLETGDIKAAFISVEMLEKASNRWLINDVRGMISAKYCGWANDFIP